MQRRRVQQRRLRREVGGNPRECAKSKAKEDVLRKGGRSIISGAAEKSCKIRTESWKLLLTLLKMMGGKKV